MKDTRCSGSVVSVFSFPQAKVSMNEWHLSLARTYQPREHGVGAVVLNHARSSNGCNTKPHHDQRGTVKVSSCTDWGVAFRASLSRSSLSCPCKLCPPWRAGDWPLKVPTSELDVSAPISQGRGTLTSCTESNLHAPRLVVSQEFGRALVYLLDDSTRGPWYYMLFCCGWRSGESSL